MRLLEPYHNDKAKGLYIIKDAEQKLEYRLKNQVEVLFKDTLKKIKTGQTKQRILQEFSQELRKIVYENRFDFERLKIGEVLQNYKYIIEDRSIGKNIDKILDRNSEINSKWFASKFGLDKKWNEKLIDSTNFYKLSLNSLGKSLAKSYENIFVEIFVEGYDSKKIEEVFLKNAERKAEKGAYEKTNIYNGRIRTLTQTFCRGIDNILNFDDAWAVGFRHFRYDGNPVPEREFCRKHYGNIYSLEEIDGLDNGQHLSVLGYLGGYNCRHSWTPTTKEGYEKNK